MTSLIRFKFFVYLYSNQNLLIMKSTVISFFASAMLLCSCNVPQTTSTDKVAFDDVIATRRSVRSYDSTKTISREEVEKLLVSTQEAPSWANQQPSKYYVAISPDKVEAVRNLTGANKDRIAGAPVLIVSTFERGKSGFFNGNATNEIGEGWGAYDNGLSNAYLVLKARAMGFDTLIMGMRDSDGLREVLEIPESETIMAVISLGYRAQEPNRPERRPLDEIAKFY